MTDTGIDRDGLRVYTAVIEHTPYGGFDVLEFLAYQGEQYIDKTTAISSWTTEETICDKLYTGTEWVAYTPFNPDDHTSFAGKVMYFENRSVAESFPAGITACFYEKNVDGTMELVASVPMEAVTDKRYKAVIPAAACSYVQFINAADGQTILGPEYSNFYGQDAQNPNVSSFVYSDTDYNTFRYTAAGQYEWGTIGGITVYYDATLSKMTYWGDAKKSPNGQAIPYPNEPVYYYAQKADGTSISGEMQSAPSADGKYQDVWSVDLPEGYQKIRFAGWKVTDGAAAAYGDGTDLLLIPTALANPCFYGDSGDVVVYEGGNRGGYWGEAYTVRDAEKGKNNTVVDIPVSTEYKRAADQLYVQTTLYDYYTDYELNGNNRDAYPKNAAVLSHRVFQSFRQWNQALSSYYKENMTESMLYWGNFQNYKGNHFTEISDNFGLTGFDKNAGTDAYKKFFYENNSMWGRNGVDLGNNGIHATQHLAADKLIQDSLVLKTAAGTTVPAPFFDKEFIEGKNSKNTVLGKVYENVTFPFVKKAYTSNDWSGTVDYWCFDSADETLGNKNLQLRQNAAKGYFMESQQVPVKGTTTQGQTAIGNYFPLNTTAESGNAALLNYGFGQKIEIKFRLTKDGTVKTTTNVDAPIEFNFFGDDDVWIYIDDVLVLDIGGDHGIVNGKINFRDRTAWVNAVKNADLNGGRTTDVQSMFPSELQTADFYQKEHTLTLFYMERGIFESNMMISFNFPDENEFAVEKEVDTANVNQDLFAGVFQKRSVFPFTIQNQATHYGTKAVQIEEGKAEPIVYHSFDNKAVTDATIAPANEKNCFLYEEGMAGKQGVVHWWAQYLDTSGAYKEQRFGVIQPSGGGAVDVSGANAYLKFKLYYDYYDTPSLGNIYIELEDAGGQKIGGYLSGKTYGASSLGNKKWNSIQVDLNKLAGGASFDYTKLCKIKFNYNYPRDIYLDDFVFIPAAAVGGKTGFITPQYDIPDYGSAKSGHLEYPEGAVYSLSGKTGAALGQYRLDASGSFALADGETAAFKDQFRRGSYLAVTEYVDSAVFDTTWTMYENGQEITEGKGGTTVDITNQTPVNHVSGTTVRDGRLEIYQDGIDKDGVIINNEGYQRTGAAKDAAGLDTTDTMVFRSYVIPDSEMMTKLKVRFCNKVKVGGIKITKKKAADSPELTGSYTFRVTFKNIAGMSLEENPIVCEYTIRAGESVVIPGIPVHTIYEISEIAATDKAAVENILITDGHNDDVLYDAENKMVSGRVQEDTLENTMTEIVFENTTKPKVVIRMQKKWQIPDGGTVPSEIRIRLERSRDAGVTWEPVRYADADFLLLTPGLDGGWRYVFRDLDQYVDASVPSPVPWLYRVTELDANGNPVASGGYVDENFKVSYSGDISFTEEQVPGKAPPEKEYVLTNRYSPRTELLIEKKDAGNPDKRLGGVVFQLEKQNEDGVTYTPVAEAVTGTDATSAEFGVARFPGLEEGVYRLSETKTAEGYILLKSPIWLRIDRVNGCTIQMEENETPTGITVMNHTIQLVVTNRLQFILPATGGTGNHLLKEIGIAVAAAAVCCLCVLCGGTGNRKQRMRFRTRAARCVARLYISWKQKSAAQK